MRTDELDFDLPEELIAQTPAQERSDSRLLHYRCADRSVTHRQFHELPALLKPGDLLVFNDARVLPARFSLLKATGGHIEGLFLSELSPGTWSVMLRNLGTPKGPVRLRFVDAPDIAMDVLSKDQEGNYRVQIDPISSADQLLARVGRMPLPPYIRREKDHDDRDAEDRERYQTVYAQSGHAVAAPTAGLHFTPELMAALDTRGIQRTNVTLNVGLGTFKPVSVSTLDEHQMHTESYTIPPVTAQMLNHAQRESRRIVAVGTTSARVLESQPLSEEVAPRTSETSIFIYPPYRWKRVGALITNFHLPRSTLIALVAARVGLEEQRRLYRIAIEHRYRFFSYGDAMLIE